MPSAPALSLISAAPAGLDSDVVAVVDRAGQASGRQPIDEHRWSQARHGGSSDQQAVVARDDGSVVGLVLLTASDGSWILDLVVDPGARRDADVVGSLVGRACEVAAADGGGPVQLWVHEADEVDERAAAVAGLIRRRDVHQLRVPLPLDVETPTVATRPFVVGEDEEAWLAVNAAAFADHPDQGRWTIDDLRRRETEPWFDPAGFLLHEVDDGAGRRLAGFNWTKVHSDAEPVGEIYVIGVHPDFAGRGLGRALCVAGLDHLSEHASTGMLYVDASNVPAMRLYRGLGFSIDHTNTAFSGLVTADA